MLKSYNATPLTSGDDITVMTYHKPPYEIMNGIKLQNVYVSSIANIASGTVTARVGENDAYAEIDKTDLYHYINFGGYSLSG